MPKPRTITLRHPCHRKEALQAVTDAPEGWTVKIGPPQKTNPQLRLAHKWFTEIQQFFLDTCGKAYTQKQVKVWLKGLFLPMEQVTTPGGVKMREKSLADVDIKEMSEFMDAVYHYMGSEFGCYLTDPRLPDE